MYVMSFRQERFGGMESETVGEIGAFCMLGVEGDICGNRM